MATISIKGAKKPYGNKSLLIHSGFLLLALLYIFYFFPDWYGTDRFHLWAQSILAAIDVFAFYIFFFLIRYFNMARAVMVFLTVFVSCLFLYYSAGINMARISDRVIEVSEIEVWFSKPWILATLPRLGLILLSALLYAALFRLDQVASIYRRYIKLEALINVALVIFFLIYKSPSINDSDFWETLFIKGLIIVVFYVHSFKISPLIFKNKKYWQFIIWLLATYVISLGLTTVILFEKNGIQFNHIEFTSFRNQYSAGYAVIILLGLLYGIIRLQIIRRFTKTETALGNTTSELLLLKSQVNPHFLFNTLNTLYATALEENATVTASATAKLANLVRYMQQDMQQEFIPLEREAGYVSDYVNIQKLRIASSLNVSTEYGDLEGVIISPGLLIPFVENAFKYGIDPDKTSVIEIVIEVSEDTIYFRCVNTFSRNHTTYYREKGFGIGIQNTRERLALIYPKNHELKVSKTEDLFTVSLKIKTT